MRDSYERVIDPDLDHTDSTLNVPPHPRQPRITFHRFVTVTLIGLGGGCGTLARWGLETNFPAPDQTIPWTTMGINALGAGLLGVLLAWLTGSGPDQGWRRRVRLTFGTGLIGGFTTYSAFSIETVALLSTNRWWIGIVYSILTLVVGLLAAGFGDRLTVAVLRRGTGVHIIQEAR